MLNSISIILSHPSHPGNIGAVARAMKNMGLTQLRLICPRQFPDESAFERASGADDILHQAQIYPSIKAAIADLQWLYGTSARKREFPWPQLNPREAAIKITKSAQNLQNVGILFGNEQSGLSNDELSHCDFHLSIPTQAHFSSLNLAAAVQVLAYEIFMAFQQNLTLPTSVIGEKASKQQVLTLLEQMEQVAVAIHYLNPSQPRRWHARLARLITKAQLEPAEVQLLRGFFKKILHKINEKSLEG